MFLCLNRQIHNFSLKYFFSLAPTFSDCGLWYLFSIFSFGGKFGQRLNQGVSESIHASQLDKFYKVLTERTKKVNDFHIINEDHLHLEYEHQTGFVPEDIKTNIFLATFTTCWARLKLYGVLDKLGEGVLYYDTDSVIYVSISGQYYPPLGDYLGKFHENLQYKKCL